MNAKHVFECSIFKNKRHTATYSNSLSDISNHCHSIHSNLFQRAIQIPKTGSSTSFVNAHME